MAGQFQILNFQKSKSPKKSNVILKISFKQISHLFKMMTLPLYIQDLPKNKTKNLTTKTTSNKHIIIVELSFKGTDLQLKPFRCWRVSSILEQKHDNSVFKYDVTTLGVFQIVLGQICNTTFERFCLIQIVVR